MERLNALGRGTQIMFIGASSSSSSASSTGRRSTSTSDRSATKRGVSAWDGFRGIVIGILTIVLLAWIIVRLAAVDIPIPVSFAMTGAVLGVIIDLRDPQEPDRRLLDDLELHRRRARDRHRRRRLPRGAGRRWGRTAASEATSSVGSAGRRARGCGAGGTPAPAAACTEQPPARRRGRAAASEASAASLARARPRPTPRMRAPTRRATSRRPSGRASPAHLVTRRRGATRRGGATRAALSKNSLQSGPVFRDAEYPVEAYRAAAAARRPTTTPKGISMANFKALSRGAQIVLVAGPLLFLSLFFTWQNVEVDYGRAGVATLPLDGWDAWGLLLALLVARDRHARRARQPHRRRDVGRHPVGEGHARAGRRRRSPSRS